MKRILGILAILMIIVGFGMMHSVSGLLEIISLLLISGGALILLSLLVFFKKEAK
ncbi:MAG: hypothetical protein ACWA6U_14055 [Breznakibacter sp.]|nr:hypothetical protein [Breznakibacter sp.]